MVNYYAGPPIVWARLSSSHYGFTHFLPGHDESASRFFSCSMSRYRFSTLVLAHGFLRRKVRLDLIEGSLLKHFIFTYMPNSPQP